MTEIINMSNIVKKYPDGDGFCKVLENVNFSMQSNDFITIHGQSGSGKTTFMQIICFMQEKTSGIYKFNNIDIENISQKDKFFILQKQIGIVYHQHNLFKDFSVYENILISLKTSNPSQSQQNFIDEILDNFQILHKKHSRPQELSGGQAQRASIARAICKKPDLLLMDEPTGNLDEETSNYVMQSIKNITDIHKISTILITHNPDLFQYSNKLYTIKNKQIV